MFTIPVSSAPRLNTQPPQPRIAPVRERTSLEGSSAEIALICIAQGRAAGRLLIGSSMFASQRHIGDALRWMNDVAELNDK
jgi:hypothetical protein